MYDLGVLLDSELTMNQSVRTRDGSGSDVPSGTFRGASLRDFIILPTFECFVLFLFSHVVFVLYLFHVCCILLRNKLIDSLIRKKTF